MAHIALYRSWRPQRFQDIVGQEHITRTLQNALKEGRLSHAYLFSGPRGTGKTSAAKILAKAVNCLHGPAEEPCNACGACERITAGAVMDVLEIDGASNRGVEEIRDIRDKVKYAPTEVRRKVYIIDEVHMLTTEAFNALLKTLEEPPAHVMFILATTEPYRLPPTIISRCQRFDFRRVSLDDEFERLKYICEQEGIAFDEQALRYIARLSDGGMRDALSLLDQAVSFADQKVTYASVLAITGGVASEQFAELAEAVLRGDVGSALEQLDRFIQEGKNADKCIEQLLYYFRDVLMMKLLPQSAAISGRVVDEQRLASLAEKFSGDRLFRMIEVLNFYQVEMKYASQPQMLFEVALMKICSEQAGYDLAGRSSAEHAATVSGSVIGVGADESIGALEARLKTLEKQLAEMAKKLDDAVKVKSAHSVGTGRSGDLDHLGDSAGPVNAGHAGGSGGSGGKAQFGGKAKFTGSGSQSTGQSGLSIRKPRLDDFLHNANPATFQLLLQKWHDILQQVRELKITVHAWLVDGEPVAATEERLLLAFKNTIHRETTDKPANKQLIEQVIANVLEKPLKLVTTMQKDWKTQTDGGEETAEELRLLPEDSQTSKYNEPWIKEAIDLFGEDLVVIKEEDSHE